MSLVSNFQFEPKTRLQNGERQIFDPTRGGWFLLTPEEFVRQFYIDLMQTEFGYPISWMKCEVEVKGDGRKKRADLIVCNSIGKPALICEFKSMDVPISEETVFQAARYNRDLGAEYVFVANGKTHRIIQLDQQTGKQKELSSLPSLNVLRIA